MNRPLSILAFLFALSAVIWLAYHLGNGSFSSTNAQLLRDIETYRNVLNVVSDENVRRPKQTQQLQAIADRTFGGDLETVDAALRSNLNRLGEELGLAGLSVRTGTASTRLSPARSEFRGSARRALRDEPDFIELEAWISGQGDLRQSLQLLHRIDAEPWIKKILQVNFTPKDNGARFDVALHLKTLFLPGQQPQSGAYAAEPTAAVAGGAASASYDPQGFEPYMQLVSANPFRVPPEQPAQAVAAAPAPPQPPAPPPFPYEKWWLTGIAQGPAGMEAWLLNRESGEWRRLAAGERLHEATLVAAAGERAEFLVQQLRFSVAVGQNLGDRTPLQQ